MPNANETNINAKTVSGVTIDDAAAYLHITELTASDETLIPQMIDAAKAYILKWTGLDEATADTCPDLVIVMYVLIQDMYDNRALYVDKSNLNNVVETILGLHSVNLL